MDVLVVDDDVVSRMMLLHLIDSCGRYEIVEAEDGEDAWTRLAAGLRPGIVFCDLRMPKLSGMDLLVRVRADAALARTPFVLVSAASDAATMAQAARFDADGYIVKPFTVEQVREQLLRALQPRVRPGMQQPGSRPEAGPDEAPALVARRLGITLDRLLVYLAGLQRQLEEALAGLAGEGQERLPRLAEGCATLGLAAASARLRALGAQPGADAGRDALGYALGAARVQEQRARKDAADSAC